MQAPNTYGSTLDASAPNISLMRVNWFLSSTLVSLADFPFPLLLELVTWASSASMPARSCTRFRVICAALAAGAGWLSDRNRCLSSRSESVCVDREVSFASDVGVVDIWDGIVL